MFLVYSFPEAASEQEEEDLCVSGVSVTSKDFSMALDVLQEAHSQAIGAPKVQLPWFSFFEAFVEMKYSLGYFKKQYLLWKNTLLKRIYGYTLF